MNLKKSKCLVFFIRLIFSWYVILVHNLPKHKGFRLVQVHITFIFFSFGSKLHVYLNEFEKGQRESTSSIPSYKMF
jgi:hypothetical protein